MLCGACVSWAQGGGAGNPQLVVAVYDDAGVAPEIVLRGEAHADRMFKAAGIEVRWRNPVWEQGSSALPKAAKAEGIRLNVRILPHSRDLAGEIFGLAFVGEDGRGQQADVFYSGIAKLSAHGSPDAAVVLGAVIAHEVGHLLLGSHSHSATGIMRGHWDGGELQLAAAGQFGFGPEQGVKMRERIAGSAFPERVALLASSGVAEKEPRRLADESPRSGAR
jgi:hypothetical protein